MLLGPSIYYMFLILEGVIYGIPEQPRLLEGVSPRPLCLEAGVIEALERSAFLTFDVEPSTAFGT